MCQRSLIVIVALFTQAELPVKQMASLPEQKGRPQPSYVWGSIQISYWFSQQKFVKAQINNWSRCSLITPLNIFQVLQR